ncbi:TetR/AcrR family transcriptional regulator [Streptomyces sp. NPDC002018]|uniref:TetR/AcrR family transcriptional regulator n=1 Tax=Streptomyces sp. NPDC002018 TaxID=3364629 RepID=UPI00369116D2
MAQPPTGAATRGRGRPPRLSEEQIVEAAVALLKRDPDTALTMKRVADAAGSAPMALYRYFPDRDALLQAAADHVMAEVKPSELTGDTWQEQIRAWMRASRNRLRPYSQLLSHMASTRQPVGLPTLDRLARILRPLGLDDDDLALALVLISSTSISYAIYETHVQPADEIAGALRAGLELRTEEEKRNLGPVLERFPPAFARLHEVIVERTITTIEALAPPR